ncbi:sodium/hydrogen exchanger [Exidia glandulosa HHB12029]|uniref:Sodium/hydrogen exchanger n=1 Tax=Exidia glandulosa HHB12029 TaxID=1314781 RepID=A0A165IP17_EXIGL|nr:sodium/hydrogen exchanger [Exidia glandulosa HHB12029]
MYSSWSLFIVCMLLILSLWTSYYLQIKRIRAVHETVVSIFAGMFVGLLVRIGPASMIRDMLTFKHTLFFNLLLPPIILNSGYELRQDYFFRNFGAILTFAFVGTFISAVGLGLLVYVYSVLGLESLHLTLLECLLFGSALSATDPVTILAIFQQYKVDPTLYSIIFGESLLNDAVSIVLYETLSHLKKSEEIYTSHFFHGVGIFLLSFSTSMAMGVAFGLACSLVLKHSSLNLFSRIESCLIALIAYTCYFFSNGLGMSGIVSLLFCGITLKHYAYHTMSVRTQRTTKYLFATLAQLSENFIFIYLGLNLFTLPAAADPSQSSVKPLLILVSTLAVVATRYAAVFPLSKVINFSYTRIIHRGMRLQTPREEPLPYQYQMMLFWAGLRGAVGVALAAGFTGANAGYLRTTVLAVVLLTVVVFGGTTARMMEIIGIRTGVEDDQGSSDDEEEPYFANSPVGIGNGKDYRDRDGGGAVLSPVYPPPNANPFSHHVQSTSFDGTQSPWMASLPSSSRSSESGEGEVFPLAPTANAGASTSSLGGGGGGAARQNSGGGRGAEGQQEGKWFHDLDQRYLLPLFSNATASRTFHARKQARKTRHTQQREQLAQQQHHDDALSDAEGGTHVWRSASTTPDGH